jgi:hypothetical protein
MEAFDNLFNSIPQSGLTLSLMIAIGIGLSAASLDASETSPSSGLEWENEITIEKNGDRLDRIHNLLTDQGKKYIAGKLFNTSTTNALHTSSNFTYISLGNGSDVQADDVRLDSELTQFGLSRAEATGINSGSVGTYTLKKKFTANLGTGDPSSLKVNTTGLNFGESGDKLISGGAFTSATLKDGDQITVTHEITISGS